MKVFVSDDCFQRTIS